MRILGLDYGSKTVGVAVTDALGWTAQGVEIIRRPEENKLRRTYARIEELIREYEVGEIVLGYPLMLSGDEGVRVEKTKEFMENLKRRTGLPIHLQDERLTTVAAAEYMEEAGIPKNRYKELVDMVAAQIILEDYLSARELERRKNHETEPGES